MQDLKSYRPAFSGEALMKKAVDREFRRKKALGQYVIVGENGKPKKIDFSVLKDSER